ncbi:MAG: helix-turn-helix domain-containing protein [Lewinella sp.]|uniref:helix-turn-helix domain-containing protein n=1 Tax=Lewinella sp. TaxID=2004506 RepID=UPI003D6B4C16
MYIHTNIKLLRKRLNLTQADLGDHLGIVGNQITRYEKGDSEPPVSKLIQLADLFEVSLQDLALTDLSKEAPKYPRPDQPYGSMDEEKQDGVLEELNSELRKRIKILEDFVIEVDPERAKRWGIIE